MGKGGKEQMAAAGCRSSSGIYMILPEWEATLLPLTTPTTSLPFSSLQQLRIPFKLPRPSFLLPSSIFSSNFLRPPRTRPSLLFNLVHPFTLTGTAATSSIVLRLSAVSSLAPHLPALLHLDGLSIFVCPSTFFCNPSLRHRNYPEP